MSEIAFDSDIAPEWAHEAADTAAKVLPDTASFHWIAGRGLDVVVDTNKREEVAATDHQIEVVREALPDEYTVEREAPCWDGKRIEIKK